LILVYSPLVNIPKFTNKKLDKEKLDNSLLLIDLYQVISQGEDVPENDLKNNPLKKLDNANPETINSKVIPVTSLSDNNEVAKILVVRENNNLLLSFMPSQLLINKRRQKYSATGQILE
jgi:hypothetical protein